MEIEYKNYEVCSILEKVSKRSVTELEASLLKKEYLAIQKQY